MRNNATIVLIFAAFAFLLVCFRHTQGYPADPLLHACIVCASASCPDVALTVYKPETLEDDMAANMRDFLANKKKGLALDKGKGVITLSKVNLNVQTHPTNFQQCECAAPPMRIFAQFRSSRVH